MTRTAIFLAVVLCAVACGTDPVTEPSPTSPVEETFASILHDRGRIAVKFIAAVAGVVHVRLNAVGPPSVPIGLGLGIPGAGSTCVLSVSITAEGASTPQISEQVDQGEYCAEVRDVGNISDYVNFSLTVEHP
jgi:hypothetical protein